MPSLKCAQCGLVNFATATACKRCGQVLVVSSGPGGIVLADGCVLPPPPNVGVPGSGVWRDKSKMVVRVIFAIVAARLVIATRIDDDFAWVKGVNKDYLNALPQWPGP